MRALSPDAAEGDLDVFSLTVAALKEAALLDKEYKAAERLSRSAAKAIRQRDVFKKAVSAFKESTAEDAKLKKSRNGGGEDKAQLLATLRAHASAKSALELAIEAPEIQPKVKEALRTKQLPRVIKHLRDNTPTDAGHAAEVARALEADAKARAEEGLRLEQKAQDTAWLKSCRAAFLSVHAGYTRAAMLMSHVLAYKGAPRPRVRALLSINQDPGCRHCPSLASRLPPAACLPLPASVCVTYHATQAARCRVRSRRCCARS